MKIDQWWMKQVAHLLEKLKSTPEGTGTMLDNTVVLVANHMSTRAGHGTASGVPMFIVGSGRGHLKTGRYVGGHARDTPHNQVLVAVAKAVLRGTELPLESFGDSLWRRVARPARLSACRPGGGQRKSGPVQSRLGRTPVHHCGLPKVLAWIPKPLSTDSSRRTPTAWKRRTPWARQRARGDSAGRHLP